LNEMADDAPRDCSATMSTLSRDRRVTAGNRRPVR